MAGLARELVAIDALPHFGIRIVVALMVASRFLVTAREDVDPHVVVVDS